jgi:alpha-glucosidase
VGIAANVSGQEKDIVLNAPNNGLNITFRTEGNRLVYEINFKGKQVIRPSFLGLELENSPILGSNVLITNYSIKKGEDNYHLLTGKTSHVSEQYNSVTIEVLEQGFQGRKMNIEARAYNDGIAFRYLVPKQRSLIEYRLKNEKTEFIMAKDPVTYAQVVPNFTSGYECEYLKMSGTGSTLHGNHFRSLVALPVLMNMEGIAWVALTEANLETNSGMYVSNFRGGSKTAFFDTFVSPDLTHPEISVVGELPHQSAWRIVMIADDPGRFIESNIITNLNPDNRISDTSWIKPGKSAWDWWSGSLNKKGEVEYSTENIKYYVNFASESGIKYMTIDEGWNDGDISKYKPSMDIPEIVQYAKSKNVKIIVWLRAAHLWNRIDEVFPLYEKWGVSGLKIDFIDRDDQAGIAFYYRVAEKAAKHKLIVDFHGACKPWGIERTYPNVVGFEGVIGMEMSKEAGRDNAENRLIIPYTRMLQGLMDYTPGGFNNVTPEEFQGRFVQPMVMGTRAHHLAMYVVYDSPFQMVSDWPEHYRGEASFEFIQQVPVTWDKTKVLNGYPEEYITVARQKGEDWFLGAMTNRAERSFELPLGFLNNGNYMAEIYSDRPDSGEYPKKIDIKTVKVNEKTKLKINMASIGGTAVYFKKIK